MKVKVEYIVVGESWRKLEPNGSDIIAPVWQRQTSVQVEQPTFQSILAAVQQKIKGNVTVSILDMEVE